MNKGLEAFNELKEGHWFDFADTYLCLDPKLKMDLILIEKSLKVLEIIKQKVVNVKDFIFYLSLVDQLGEENIIDLCCGCSKIPLTKKEFDLLKETLK